MASNWRVSDAMRCKVLDRSAFRRWSTNLFSADDAEPASGLFISEVNEPHRGRHSPGSRNRRIRPEVQLLMRRPNDLEGSFDKVMVGRQLAHCEVRSSQRLTSGEVQLQHLTDRLRHLGHAQTSVALPHDGVSERVVVKPWVMLPQCDGARGHRGWGEQLG